jgi:hypothetical protein
MRRLLLYPNVCFRPKAAISRASVSDPLQKRARLIVSNDRGTGTEDYFGGAWDFAPLKTHEYQTFTGLYSGLPQIIRPEDSDNPIRFGLYRWHIPDPIRFKSDLRVTMQMLGWTTSGPREYDPLHEHVSSVAFWYQTEPHQPFGPLASDAELNVR